MKKIFMIWLLLLVVFAGAAAIACPLPMDVKIQKVTTNDKRLVPVVDAALTTRLRSQIREAFNCGKKQSNGTSKSIVNVELVEILHYGVNSTRVNVATDQGFFSAYERGRGVYIYLSAREQFEEVMKKIAEDISKATCKK